MGKVDRGIRLRRIGAVELQHRPIGAIERHAPRTDMGEKRLGEVLVEMPGRARRQRDGREVSGGETVFEIGHAKAGDRWDENQHLAHHDEKDGEDQQTGGQAPEEHPDRSSQPNQARKRTSRRVRAENRVGV